jgi:hypothetical protein
MMTESISAGGGLKEQKIVLIGVFWDYNTSVDQEVRDTA